jgi:3-dehydroquinate synthase
LNISAHPLVEIAVGLGDRAYDIVIGHQALDMCGERLRSFFRCGRALVVTDSNVGPLHGPRLEAVLEQLGIETQFITVPAGEQSKSFEGLQTIVDALLDANIERGEVVIALGGGVVGDLAGFAASITKRGVDFIQIPTTLLAQVDSSVGGKTGINTRHGKNFAGTFHQPRLVIADSGFLSSLPDREIRAGYAEIVKAALIGDTALFERLEAAGPDILRGEDLTHAISDAVRFKANIVAKDEREAGVRALLNLGHTFAHAFEADAPKDAIRHGEAVAVGLALAFRFSAEHASCDPADAGRVEAHLRQIGLPAAPQDLPFSGWSAQSLIERMRGDKKNMGGKITLILAHGIGNAYIDHDIDETDLVRFLKKVLK